LALGGGGARGLAHIGVLKVLEEAGVEPDLVTGSSFGGLVAIAWAAGLTSSQIKELALSTSVASVLGRDHTGLGLSGRSDWASWPRASSAARTLKTCHALAPCWRPTWPTARGSCWPQAPSPSPPAPRRPYLACSARVARRAGAGGWRRARADSGGSSQSVGATRVIAVHVGPARERPIAQWLPLGLAPRPLASAPFLHRLLSRWRLLDVGIKALEVQSLEIAEMRLAGAQPWLVLRPAVGELRLDDFARQRRVSPPARRRREPCCRRCWPTGRPSRDALSQRALVNGAVGYLEERGLGQQGGRNRPQLRTCQHDLLAAANLPHQ